MILKLQPSFVRYTSDVVPYIYGELETPVYEVIAYLKKYLDSDPCCLPFIEIYSLDDKYYTIFNSGLFILKELEKSCYLSETHFKYVGEHKSHPVKITSLNDGHSVIVDEAELENILSEDECSTTSDGSDTSSYDSEDVIDFEHSTEDHDDNDNDCGSGCSSDGDDDESLGEIPGFATMGLADDGCGTDQDDDDDDGSFGESADDFDLSNRKQ